MKKTKKVAIWMYTNDNGYIPRGQIRKKLEFSGCEVFSDFDMRECYVINGETYTKCGENLSKFDALFHMNADEQSTHQLDILRSIEDSGVKVINELDSFFLSRDKYRSNTLLRKAGVRVPKSVLIGVDIKKSIVESIFRGWGGAVFKSRFGHGANGIIKFSNSENFWDFFLATKSYIHSYYLEEFITFGDSDCRIEIFNGEVLGGYSRHKNHSFKTNISSGGKMMPREIGKEALIAKKSSNVLGINGTIVDMVESTEDGEIYVLEVNPLLGIFVESAMKAETKMTYTEPHPEYCYDDRKVEVIVNYILANLDN